MTLRTRRIIYISLIIFFFALAPLIIIYSLGYSFDWQKKSLVKTGSFYFKSYPANAEIFVNDESQGATPLYIKRLLPREYSLKISKEGFLPWEKKMSISSQLVTEARNIFLPPKNIKIETIQESIAPDFSFNNYFLDDSERKNITLARETAANILKTDSWAISENKIFYFGPADRILYQSDLDGFNKKQLSLEPLAAEIYKISVSRNQNHIFVLSKSERLYLFDSEKNIFTLVNTGVKNAGFSADSKKLLYYTGFEISVIYLEKIQIQPYHEANEKELITRFADNITSAVWYPEDNEHIIFVVNNTIKITELDGRDKRNTIDLVKMSQSFQPSNWDNPQLYYATDKELLYFINNKNLYTAQIKGPQSIIEATGLFNYGK